MAVSSGTGWSQSAGNPDEMILIVDDEPSALVLLDMILKRDGYIVRKASTGKEALRLLDREDEQVCELLVTDIRMPEMDGRQLVARLRANPRTASIPVIMCTSTSDRATVVELIGQGVRDYIVKPVSASTLLAKVRSVLYSHEPVIEARARTVERLQIEFEEYGALAAATIPSLEQVESELAAALLGRNGRTVRAAAERVREPASLFGAKRAIAAARSVISATNDRDALECGEALVTELADLRSALVRVATGLMA
jgi:DNA-binding response OmpR family regulator